MVNIEQKANGFVVSGDIGGANKELLVEGRDAKKIGAAVLAMFQKPRKPRAKRVEKEKALSGTA
jgi:hypothetical protein